MSTTPHDLVATFEAPLLSPLAALRDRREEAAERAIQLRHSGYADGYESGMAAAAAEVERAVAEHRLAVDRLDSATAAVERATRDLAARDQVTITELEREAVAMAVAMASDLVGRELAATTEPVLDALERAARLLPGRGTPTIRVHPDDEATTREAVAADVIRWTDAVRVVGDPTVEPGGCVVDVDPCRIDAQIGPALDRLRRTLA